MAFNTDPKLQSEIIYSIYVRAHTAEGTFRAIIPDLDRIPPTARRTISARSVRRSAAAA